MSGSSGKSLLCQNAAWHESFMLPAFHTILSRISSQITSSFLPSPLSSQKALEFQYQKSMFQAIFYTDYTKHLILLQLSCLSQHQHFFNYAFHSYTSNTYFSLINSFCNNYCLWFHGQCINLSDLFQDTSWRHINQKESIMNGFICCTLCELPGST